MITKVRALIVIAFAVAGIGLAFTSNSQASSAGDKAEIVALFQRLAAAYSQGDINAVMAFYSDDPDAIFFEDTIPFELNKAELRNSLEIVYKSISDSHARVESLDVQISGDLAIAHCVIHNSWNDKHRTYLQISRLTEVFRKEGGKWLI
jgi:ketosteroid isomerase-like protein